MNKRRVGQMHAARVRVVVHPDGGIAAALASAATLYQPDGPGAAGRPRGSAGLTTETSHQACRDGAVTSDRRRRVGQDRAWETRRTATMFCGISRPDRSGQAGRDQHPAWLWVRRCGRLGEAVQEARRFSTGAHPFLVTAEPLVTQTGLALCSRHPPLGPLHWPTRSSGCPAHPLCSRSCLAASRAAWHYPLPGTPADGQHEPRHTRNVTDRQPQPPRDPPFGMPAAVLIGTAKACQNWHSGSPAGQPCADDGREVLLSGAGLLMWIA
jgi:hypothetical protein